MYLKINNLISQILLTNTHKYYKACINLLKQVSLKLFTIDTKVSSVPYSGVYFLRKILTENLCEKFRNSFFEVKKSQYYCVLTIAFNHGYTLHSTAKRQS